MKSKVVQAGSMQLLHTVDVGAVTPLQTARSHKGLADPKQPD